MLLLLGKKGGGVDEKVQELVGVCARRWGNLTQCSPPPPFHVSHHVGIISGGFLPFPLCMETLGPDGEVISGSTQT